MIILTLIRKYNASIWIPKHCISQTYIKSISFRSTITIPGFSFILQALFYYSNFISTVALHIIIVCMILVWYNYSSHWIIRNWDKNSIYRYFRFTGYSNNREEKINKLKRVEKLYYIIYIVFIVNYLIYYAYVLFWHLLTYWQEIWYFYLFFFLINLGVQSAS